MTHGRAQTGARIITGWRRAIDVCGAESDRSPLHLTDLNQVWPKQADADWLLDQLRRANVTSVIIHNDRAALAFTLRARALGLRIPEDLSVISYDDELAEMVDPPLTAVSPPKGWLGQTAVELLLGLMTGAVDEPVRQIVAAPGLKIRGSTAPPG